MSAISAPCCLTNSPILGRRSLIPMCVVASLGSASAAMSGCDETFGISESSILINCAHSLWHTIAPLLCFALTLEEDCQHDKHTNDDTGNIIWHIQRHECLTNKLNEDGPNHCSHDGCMLAGQ